MNRKEQGLPDRGMYTLVRRVINPQPMTAGQCWYALGSWGEGTKFFISTEWLGVPGEDAMASLGTSHARAIIPNLERVPCKDTSEIMLAYGLTTDDLPWLLDSLCSIGRDGHGAVSIQDLEVLAESRSRLGSIHHKGGTHAEPLPDDQALED